ncbi:IPExxxVDY family protein [Siansivirga zeaxanthinifaciens]|uniref:IPExxxVDY family protein n=1 Tax=Siansivirga zeaxanthinifaciens CC-SAMT-1 TaxID=1454006 RepID=A0A0C5W7A0_9FLAO|nr:IPExxxVDY family protein [Siansivirga zeaxanthinifaciens]AJR03038.1 hypothetical protein AW14_04720 [Siansivirga zeaxanthinifaciens CC-SAMT-1]
MAVHKLVLEDVFDEVTFTLIAIHCSIKDYRLAYLLNKNLGIRLARKASDLDFSVFNSMYSIFEWEDCKHMATWSLVSNICKTEILQEVNFKSLFDTQEKIIKTNYLIPEYKSVNYFLKIENEYHSGNEKYILDSILKIPQVVTAFSVDTALLKSKDNLIFS